MEIVLILIVAFLTVSILFLGFLLLKLHAKSQGPEMNQQVSVALSEIGALKEALRSIESMQKDTHTIVASEVKMRDVLQSHLDETLKTVERIKTDYEARRKLEEETRGYIMKMTDVLTGTKSKGIAGENILREAFKSFPVNMLKNNFRVKGKEVEFGLVLTGGKVIPVDSKWPAADLLEELGRTEDDAGRAKISERIEREVIKRISEVAQYIDLAVTAPWAVAAIPDVAYSILRKAHIEAYEKRVILISYSMAMPYLLTHFILHLQYSSAIDVENLEQYLMDIKRNLSLMEEVLENKLETASTMLKNANLEYRHSFGAIRNSIASLESARPREANIAGAEKKELEV